MVRTPQAEEAPRGYHHGDLRASLVEAASRLLESEGAVALSLRRVAREAGVSHTAPYRHFKDKHELLEAVAAAGFRALEDRLDGVWARFPDDPRRQIVEACGAYVAETAEHPARTHLMFGGFLDPARRSSELEHAIHESFGKLLATVRRGEGTLYRDLPTRELLLTMWSATHGLALLHASGQLEGLGLQGGIGPAMERMMGYLFEGLERRAEDGSDPGSGR